VTHTVKTEELPSPTMDVEPPVSPKSEEITLDTPSEPKRHALSRSSSHYSHHRSHPVPKPLTLQGEKIFDADYPQTNSRTIACTTVSCQRRGSLKGQPLITELFQDTHIEIEKPIVKPEPIPPTKPSIVKMKKLKPNFIKNPKPKKAIVTNKPKPSTSIAEKIEMKCQSTSTDMNEEQNTNENMIIIGGTDWIMAVKPQAIAPEESELSQLDQVSTVDDEDIPYCVSPTDQLAASQSTLMTSIGDIAVCISVKRIYYSKFYFLKLM
jgi:hypothetical protein